MYHQLLSAFAKTDSLLGNAFVVRRSINSIKKKTNSILVPPSSSSSSFVSIKHVIIHQQQQQRSSSSSSLSMSKSNENKIKPKLIVFDLDGCLWKPEMYELSWYASGAPFRRGPNERTMLTRNDETVSLIGDIPDIMKSLYNQQSNILVGISSRTDVPEWANELLDKFLLSTTTDDDNDDNNTFALREVFDPNLIEISKDSKVNHFQRLSKQTGLSMKDIIFFDNESGNCRQISQLGVTVGYSPNGVTNQIFQATCNAFPSPKGMVVGMDL